MSTGSIIYLLRRYPCESWINFIWWSACPATVFNCEVEGCPPGDSRFSTPWRQPWSGPRQSQQSLGVWGVGEGTQERLTAVLFRGSCCSNSGLGQGQCWL